MNGPVRYPAPQPRPRPGRSTRRSPRTRGSVLRWVLIPLLLAALAGAALYGVQAMRRQRVAQEVAPYDGVFAPNIAINGMVISGMTRQQAFDALWQQMNDQLNAWSLNLTYRGHRYATLTYPLLGITIAPEQLVPYLNEAWKLTHTGDVFARKQALEARAANPYAAYTQTGTVSAGRVDEYLSTIAGYINRAPQDAQMLQFNPDSPNQPFTYQQEQEGLTLDTVAAREDILTMASSGQSGDYEMKPTPIAPQITVADLSRKYALRATAQTSISRYSPDARNNNIRVAFSRFNGLVLKDGQEFSFNRIVGPRELKTGFFEADEYAYGDLVTGVGGGVCQASTTVYQAALKAAMTITDRTAHSDPVNYTDKGLDATVYYSRDHKIDFKFRNKSGGNIYISAHVKPAGNNASKLICTVSIYGLSLGDQVTYRLRTQLLETLTYVGEPIYRLDKKQEHVIYQDQTEQIRKGKEGYVVAAYLQKVQGANVLEERLISTDTYAPKAPEYWRGVTPR